MPNPRSGLVYKGVEICKSEKVGFYTCSGRWQRDRQKPLHLALCTNGDFWDFYNGKRGKSPSGSNLLTLTAAGSEGSTGSVITHENGMLKRAANSDLLRPVFSILNPELTCSLPAYQTACGATDMMAHDGALFY